MPFAIIRTTRATLLVSAALAVCAVGAPGVVAAPADQQAPGAHLRDAADTLTRSGATTAQSSTGHLRDAADSLTASGSPRSSQPVPSRHLRDAADALVADPGPSHVGQAAPGQDLRSPDAVDAATPRLDGAQDGVSVSSSVSESSGFDWSSAGIAMAALLGLIIVAAAAATHVRHTRGSVARP